jgi:hypothetical protein
VPPDAASRNTRLSSDQDGAEAVDTRMVGTIEELDEREQMFKVMYSRSVVGRVSWTVGLVWLSEGRESNAGRPERDSVVIGRELETVLVLVAD